MMQATSHSFPSKSWIHRITKGKKSNKCDLCKTLWLVEDRFTTEKDLPEQTLGHMQHTCEALSAAHIDSHHQCSGEKCLQTIWNEMPLEIEGLKYLNTTQDAIWNAARTREIDRPLWEESIRVQEDQSRETIAKDRF